MTINPPTHFPLNQFNHLQKDDSKCVWKTKIVIKKPVQITVAVLFVFSWQSDFVSF